MAWNVTTATRWGRNNGFLGENEIAKDGLLDGRVTDPIARQKMQQAQQTFNSAPASTAAGGVVPITIEPRHDFEKQALRRFGSGDIGQISQSNPRADRLMDKFESVTDDSIALTKQGGSGFNQSEFDEVFNPYTEQVTQRSVDQLTDRAKDMRANLLRQMSSNRGNASFGDLYGAQRLGDIDEELISTAGDVLLQGNNAGFSTALESLFRTRSNQLQAGQQLAGTGANFANGANAAQSQQANQVQVGQSLLNNQLSAGTNIRGFNQNMSDAAFANRTLPTTQQNAATEAALNRFNTVSSNLGAQYNTPNINRFGEILQGAGGIADQLSQVRF